MCIDSPCVPHSRPSVLRGTQLEDGGPSPGAASARSRTCTFCAELLTRLAQGGTEVETAWQGGRRLLHFAGRGALCEAARGSRERAGRTTLVCWPQNTGLQRIQGIFVSDVPPLFAEKLILGDVSALVILDGTHSLTR